MDKREFLSALERSLSVLEEDELRDIVSEYEQHIDIKVEKGLTEAEAIADFGSLAELTGEILEAYHVRADYAADKREGGRKGAGVGQDWKNVGAAALERAKTVGIGAASCIRWTGHQLFRPFSWLWRRFWDLAVRMRERPEDDVTEGRKKGGIGLEPEGGKSGSIGREPEGGKSGGIGLESEGVKSGGIGLEPEGGKSGGIGREPESGKSGGIGRESGTWEDGRAGLEAEGRGYGSVREAIRDGGPKGIGREADNCLHGDDGAGLRRGAVRQDRRGKTGGAFRESGMRQRIKRKGKRVADNMGKGILWIFRTGAAAIAWAARMVWNGCWILFSLGAAVFGLLSLYGLGILAVLLIQGYPLIGVTLGCLGLVMCAFSAAVLGTTFLFRTQNNRAKNRGGRTGQSRVEQKMRRREDEDPRGGETQGSPQRNRKLDQEADSWPGMEEQESCQPEQEEKPGLRRIGGQGDRRAGRSGKTAMENSGEIPAGDQSVTGEEGQRHA